MLHESAIDVFESFIGVSLPKDYRGYIKTTNGGTPQKNSFNIPGQGDDVVNRFFSLVSKNKSETLPYAIKLYKERIPGEMIPIGNDPGGNLILISTKGDQRSCIFFWDHDTEADDEPQPFYGNITLVSKSFSSFIESLC